MWIQRRGEEIALNLPTAAVFRRSTNPIPLTSPTAPLELMTLGKFSAAHGSCIHVTVKDKSHGTRRVRTAPLAT